MTFRKRISLLIAEFHECTLMAVDAVVNHKLRSSLTLIGIMVGVFSIILVETAMYALEDFVGKNLVGLGANTAQIKKWPTFNFASPSSWEKYARRTDLDYKQFQKLQQRATLAKGISIDKCFTSATEVFSRYDFTNPDVSLYGITPQTFSAHNIILEQGREITETDIRNRTHVCILGKDLASKLFPFSNALGEKVRCRSISYTVVGTLEKKGSLFDTGADNRIYIPLTTGMGYFGQRHNFDFLVESFSQDQMDETIYQVRGILRTLRGISPVEEDDFEIETNQSLIEQLQNLTLTIRIGIIIISSIALITAGIGIMNIMLVSVTERTREIGVRRAIGARKRQIMIQFIMEAVLLCQFGGIAGVILGIAGANLAMLFLSIPAAIPLNWVLIGLISCSLIGIIFGSYPALKAANLDPIQSLRHE